MTAELDVKGTLERLEDANVLISYSGYISDQTLEGVAQGIKAVFESHNKNSEIPKNLFDFCGGGPEHYLLLRPTNGNRRYA